MTSNRRLWALFLAALILGSVLAPYAAAGVGGLISALPILSNGYNATAGVTYGANTTGPHATLDADTKVESGAFADNATALNLTTTNYQLWLKSDVFTHARIVQGEGPWTKVSNLDVTNGTLTINPADKRAIGVSGNTNRLEFRNAQLDDGTVDVVYAGTSGTTTLVIRGLPANRGIVAIDADTDERLAVNTTDTSGTVTLSGMPNSEHRVTLQRDSPPTLTDPDPTGNLSTRPSEFSVHVADDDFTADNVSVEFFYEGSKFDTVFTQSNGRVNTSTLPPINAGVSEWSAVATDANGNQDIINATIGVPGDLTIRNETNASEILTSPINVTVKFYNGTIIYTRNTTTGSINMSGLPPGDFIVEAEANQDFYKRVVYFPNIVGNRSVYLLNRTYPAVQTRFVLDDPTGQFPSESIIIIKRGINRSGTTKFRTIYSDKFGVEGVTVDLENDTRYLISIRAPDGRTQLIGPYRSDVSEEVTVRPGNPTIDIENYEKGWGSAASLTNQTLSFRYDDPENSTSQVTVWVHEKGNESNQLRPNVSFYDLGDFDGVYTLTSSEQNTTWVVNFVITFDDGRTVVKQHEVASRPDIAPPLSNDWKLIFGVGLLLISAGIFSMLNSAVGGVIVSIEGGVLWWLGILPGATSGAAVVISLFICVLFAAYRSRAGP